MQITLTKEQVKEAFGELRFMGADNCYRYDKDSKKKTEEVEALKLHLGSMKLGNSVDIRLEATELPKIEPYAVVELEEPVYAPYVQRGNFPVLVATPLQIRRFDKFGRKKRKFSSRTPLH